MRKFFKEEIKGAVIIEGHIQGLSNTRALGEAGIPVIVIDRNNCLARYSRYCSGFFYCPDYLSSEFISFLITLADEQGLKEWLLLPSNDHAVYSISHNLDKLSGIYKTIVPEPEILDLLYDKYVLADVAIQADIPVPYTFSSEHLELNQPDKIRFPVITKGKNGLSFFKSTGKKAILSNNLNELKKNLAYLSSKHPDLEIYTQELVPMNKKTGTISFTAFCIRGEIMTYWIGEKIREHPYRFGTGTFARSIENNELLIQSMRLIKRLDYTGICEIEYVLDPRDNKSKLIEINARTWLWVGLARECGIDYALIIYNYLNRKAVEYPDKYMINVNWVNLATDIPYSIISMIKGRLSPLSYLKSFRGKTIYAIASSRDILPGLIFIILSIYIVFKRR
jgi:predicted ATP-grasp superfamily ATP-dependent carboligase